MLWAFLFSEEKFVHEVKSVYVFFSCLEERE